MSNGKVLDFFTERKKIIKRKRAKAAADSWQDAARKRYKVRCRRNQGENLCKNADRGNEEVVAAVHIYEHELRMLGYGGFIQLDKFPDGLSAKIIQSSKYHLPDPAMEEMGKLTTTQKTYIVLEMMSMAHRVWSKRHSPNFFSYFAGRESVYLPVELFGSRWLKIFFLRLSSFDLEDFGLGDVTLFDVYKNYNDWRQPFLKKYGITNYRTLCTAIPKIAKSPCCRDLSPEVREALRIPEIAEKIARQVFFSDPQTFTGKYKS